ncbi:MAG: glutathionylspermidine synthase family protein [Pseudomonas sp.]|uniref:glutathionylspermidine synthase family protein n=1 Tax=Pseudomonas abieticivorans TaxID=2931382 RepID=UPI0020BD8E63|nr:glutathionylspermidine synthase family protein [Pseudomonas sp. PIA16]MDE1168352.1 glutathionylspermidine synthase family protein [Pseudomonas sp.]
MKKIAIAERADWKQTAEGLGFLFHTIDGEPYWDESAYYQFSLAQIERDLEDPTTEIHEMCMDLVDRVVRSEELLDRLSIPAGYYDLIRTSWLEGHPHLYGRMDFSYGGSGPAKLLELNYDTPTSLYEAAAFQWGWLEQCIERGMIPARADQFNSIDTRLHEALAALQIKKPFYFASIKGSVEDKATTDYLRLIAGKVGIESRHIDVEDIGLLDGRFVDLENRWIPHLFKLHAWEFIFHEEFGQAVAAADTQFFEPPWKAVLSNKGILPLLWEQHKGHPNLLAAHLDTDVSKPVPKGWVRKPFFSREGANIELRTADDQVVREEGPYDDAPFILQEFAALPRFGDSYTLVGSWVIGDQAAGIGIREDNSLITKDTSRFLPHLILD